MDKTIQVRTIGAIETRAADDENKTPEIAGYFSVFDETYNICEGYSERIDPRAFDKSIGGDIRALIDHDTSKVLGRTTAGTLSLKTDSHGLFGVISINTNDREALDLYARVKRGDVNQCSFGFIIDEAQDTYREDGSVLTTITDLTLFEVSVCTFPAYESTEVEARAKEAHAHALEAWRESMHKRLEPENDNITEKETNGNA